LPFERTIETCEEAFGFVCVSYQSNGLASLRLVERLSVGVSRGSSRDPSPSSPVGSLARGPAPYPHARAEGHFSRIGVDVTERLGRFAGHADRSRVRLL